MENIKERIEKLRKEIISADIAFAMEAPTLTDSEYDEKYLELEALEKAYPEYYDASSPTQKIYDIEVDGLKKVKHNVLVGSQDKIHTEDEIREFCNTLPKDSKILVEDKLDGLTIVLRYENGKLVVAITRGRGEYGEDVTHVIFNVDNVPKQIPFDHYLELRLEGLIPNHIVEKLWNEGEMKNARNLASGTIRTLNGAIAKERGLICKAFDIIEIEDKEFNSDLERIEFIKSLGFDFVEPHTFINNEEGVNALVDFVLSYNKEVRPNLPYKIDGLVIKTDDLSVRQELGMGKKSPKWSTAFKFEAEEYRTKLIDLEWSVGKSGILNPNGIIETVVIDNTNVNRASLANIDDITRRDIRLYDQVMVVKANEIIPKILRPITEIRTGNEKVIEIPTECPFCGASVKKEGSYIFCTNKDCSGRQEAKLRNFVGKDGLDIVGLGGKTIETFIEKGIVKSYSDILHLNDIREEILALPKFGEKKLDKILDSFEKSKNTPLSKVLTSLSIRNVAVDKSLKLAREFKSMRAILEASKDMNSFKERLSKIADYGDVRVNSVANFFNDYKNIELIEEMLSLGFTMEEEVLEARESSITGKTFVITGTLSKSRGDFKKYLESLGAKVTGSVSKKTDYLLLGADEEGSTKHNKAKELGIAIISEEELNDLVK